MERSTQTIEMPQYNVSREQKIVLSARYNIKGREKYNGSPFLIFSQNISIYRPTFSCKVHPPKKEVCFLKFHQNGISKLIPGAWFYSQKVKWNSLLLRFTHGWTRVEFFVAIFCHLDENFEKDNVIIFHRGMWVIITFGYSWDDTFGEYS